MKEMNNIHINDYMRYYNSSYQPSIDTKNKYFKKGPNCPLLKGPFIKMKIECKNIHKLIKPSSPLKENNEKKYSNFSRASSLSSSPSRDSNEDKYKYKNKDKEKDKDKPLFDTFQKYSVNPTIKITLNNQVCKLPSINHNNPKWINTVELDIPNFKEDKIFFEIYDSKKTEIKTFDKEMRENKIISISEKFLGFQVLPIKYLEMHNLIGIGTENQLNFGLINKHPYDYFVNDERDVLHIRNHDPKNYRIEDGLLKDYNYGK
jgi:hypothetical protein